MMKDVLEHRVFIVTNLLFLNKLCTSQTFVENWNR